MYLDLDQIKPKRLSETKQAILSDGFCVLDFGNTLIYKKCDVDMPLSIISHKDLFSNEYDEAVRIDSYPLPFDIEEMSNLSYKEITISVADSTYLSSVSAAGEDLFFYGIVGVSKNYLNIMFQVSGLIYFNEFKAKSKDDIEYFHYIDYNVFYYLFQMFKNLSGKKTSKLLIAKYNDNLYLTNEDRDYYIISKNPKKLTVDYFKNIEKFFKNRLFVKTDSIVKKDYVQDKDSFIKHITRPLGDVCFLSEDKDMTVMSMLEYKVWILKEKV